MGMHVPAEPGDDLGVIQQEVDDLCGEVPRLVEGVGIGEAP